MLGAMEMTIRMSTVEEDEPVARLAPLGSPPRGTVVVAEVGGAPVAAVGLADGRMAADPQRSSPTILTALRLRRWEVWLIGAVFGY
jgi:hypothetical protein